jgi:hypothetical protein
MNSHRWWTAPVPVLFLLTLALATSLAVASMPDASADSVRCDARAAPDALRVYCERHVDGGGMRNSGFQRTRRRVEAYPGEFAMVCITGGQPGLQWRRIVTTWDGHVVVDGPVCRPVDPAAAANLPGDAEVAEAVQGSRVWPVPTVGTDPAARGLVAYPFELVCTGDAPIAVGPLTLSDGSTAVGAARVTAVEWMVDGDPVAATSSCAGEPGRSPVGYLWSTAGDKDLAVRLQWIAELTVTSTTGVSEQRVVGDIVTEAAAGFTVEQVQAVIDYER